MTDHRILCGDSLAVLPTLDAESVDAIVCDPPYGLSFMGKEWDHGVPGEAFWREALRVAKPGAHLVAFGGTRTYHRLAVAIEDAGWEIRDCLSWNFGSGFPKSHNIDKTGVSCACEDDLPGMQPRVLAPTVSRKAVQPPIVFTEVQRDGSGAGMGAARLQGVAGPQDVYADVRPTESGLEGRSDTEASEGELLGSEVRPVAGVGVAYGAEGRLHRGASVGDGATGGPFAESHGSGAPPESRPIGQQAGELGTVADQRLAQAGGVWPTCERCGKPRIARGLGTALKPAWEPIILARKPLIGTVASNVAQYGTGGINVDATRIGTEDNRSRPPGKGSDEHYRLVNRASPSESHPLGRWPANVCLDEEAAEMLDAQSGYSKSPPKGSMGGGSSRHRGVARGEFAGVPHENGYGDSGGASRFFYTAKASRREREAGLEGMPERERGQQYGNVQDARPHTGDGYKYSRKPTANHHPTVKPIALMRWLCRLVTPKGGLVLDPFTGSGTTGCAAVLEGFRFVGVEREPEYAAIAEKRIAHWAGQRDEPSLFGG